MLFPKCLVLVRQLEEDIFQAQTAGFEFVELPARLHYCPGQFCPHVMPFFGVDFKRHMPNALGPGRVRVAMLDQVYPGYAFQPALHLAFRALRREQDSFVALQPPGELIRRTLRHKLAGIDHHNALAGLRNFGQNVGAEHDGVLAGQGLDQFTRFNNLLGVKSRGRLVKN